MAAPQKQTEHEPQTRHNWESVFFHGRRPCSAAHLRMPFFWLHACDMLCKAALLFAFLVGMQSLLRFGGERIVFTFECSKSEQGTFWVYERATHELRGVSEPHDACRVDALFNFQSGEILDVYRSSAATSSEKARCRHRFDDVAADFLWGYERVVVGAPWRLSCNVSTMDAMPASLRGEGRRLHL